MSSDFKSFSAAFKIVLGKCDKAFHCRSRIGNLLTYADRSRSTENPKTNM